MHRESRRCLLAIVFVVGCVGSASAGTITAKCQGQDADKPYAMTMVYEGDDSGTLKISGSFGDMSFPAAKRSRHSVTAGETIDATKIWGGAEVPLVVPDKGAVEACVKGKLSPGQITDADIVFITIPSCAAAAPPTAQPITVKVYAEFTFLDAETVLPVFQRTYLEKTDLPGGTLTLEIPPTSQCTIE
jgi:hypothetical protein